MKNMIKTELWKALRNPWFYLALALGCGIVALDVIQNAYGIYNFNLIIQDTWNYGFARSATGYSLFVNWMGVSSFSYGSVLFFNTWPILAALPFSWSYAKERKNGVYNQLVCRCGKKTYFCAKVLAVFVSGGLAVSVPLLVDLLVNAMVLPDMLPNVLMEGLGQSRSFLIELYFTYPWIHALLWLGIDFLWGGTAACLCFVVGSKLRLQVLTMLVPYVIFYLLDWAGTMLFNNISWIPCELSPMELARAITLINNPGWIIFLEMGVLLAIGLIFGYRQVVKRELA